MQLYQFFKNVFEEIVALSWFQLLGPLALQMPKNRRYLYDAGGWKPINYGSSSVEVCYR